ncbi:MAG: peroxidase family protein, partial [Pseudomonadota bacterium]
WTPTPIKWDSSYLDTLFGHEWEQTTSPAGAIQFVPAGGAASDAVPDAHNPERRHQPIMFTTDLALRTDPSYEKIARRFHADPDLFADAFARAWFKLTHRDMGPHCRGLGAEVPKEPLLWQDPVPAVDHPLVDDADVASLKETILASDHSLTALVKAAWASAASYRDTDKRGGANGARVALDPQKEWAVNDPAELTAVLATLAEIKADFDSAQAPKKVSIADLIVLAGTAAVERATANGGNAVAAPFTPGRTDATDAMTDAESFAVLEPKADGFRNYMAAGQMRQPSELLVDRAQMLGLTAPEMTVLLGGMRALGANTGDTAHGVFGAEMDQLSTVFFDTVLDRTLEWVAMEGTTTYEGKDRATGDVRYTATQVDLVFGSNSQLRAISEVYGCDDAGPKFARDFVAAWTKVMMNDRFELVD